jgi:chemotaxis protein methyltransferase CheR
MTDGRIPGLERFVDVVVSRLGFRVHENNEGEVERLLRQRLQHTGCGSVAAYLERYVDAAFAATELREIALELTVAETYFFRHPDQFRAFVEVALPDRIRARQGTRRLNVLSAGCATGEEPYSLAAAMSDFPELRDWDVRIWGIDVNPRLLEVAAAARYSDWSLRSGSTQQRSRFFRPDGDRYVLDASLARAVRFEARNLLEDDPQFWQPDFFDVVFCRNVMIYFSSVAVRSLVERFTRSLVPCGYLFLGPSETLRGISREFHLRHTQDAFYYQRRLLHEQVELAAPLADAGPRSASAAHALPERRNPDWVSAIAASSTRIAALADSSRLRSEHREPASPQQAQAAVRTELDLDEVRDLVREERFEDALLAIGALPGQAATDPDAMLLQAVVLANRGNVAGAEEICRRLLARDELRPGAHYLLAFCQERRGDVLSAAEHDQTAIYLDPAFAMPRLHLGLLALRMGDLPTARRELREALSLLAREDASRMLLFGGGFDRGALMRLCEAQLERCGGGE